MPVRRYVFLFFVAHILIDDMSQAPVSSVNASEAVRSPDAISGRYFFLYSSDAPYSIAFAVKTAVEKYGAQSKDRPISSKTMHCSDKPNPWPPYSSGIAIAVKPNSVLTFFHCSFSQPASVAIKRRTSVVGDFSSKKRLRNDLNSSCSSEKLNFILTILPCKQYY